MCSQGVLWQIETADLRKALLAKRECLSVLERHEGWSLDSDAAHLVYNELVGNVLRHGAPPVRITLQCYGSEVELQVADGGRGFDLTGPRMPDVLSERGRGMYLVSQYAEKVEAAKEPDGGMTVTVALRRAPPA